MDTRRLAMFLAVVDEGTFTAAARASYVSQSALSQAIQELEKEVGVALFERLGRRVALTAAGEALIEPSRQALRDLANARSAVAAVAGVEAGHLDLVALPTLAVEPVARIIGQFRRAHPAVRVNLADPDDPDDLIRAIRSGTAELGITDQPSTSTGLAEVRLRAQTVVLAFPPGAAPASVRAADAAAGTGRLPDGDDATRDREPAAVRRRVPSSAPRAQRRRGDRAARSHPAARTRGRRGRAASGGAGRDLRAARAQRSLHAGRTWCAGSSCCTATRRSHRRPPAFATSRCADA